MKPDYVELLLEMWRREAAAISDDPDNLLALH
jgi:hypothetical protein